MRENYLPIQLRGQQFADFGVEEVVCHFQNHPTDLETKAGWELLAGCIMAKCRQEAAGTDCGIAYRIRESVARQLQQKKPTLSDVISKPIAEDSDTDLYLWENGYVKPLQITRLEERHPGLTNKDKLVGLIQKKLHARGQSGLFLVILADVKMEIGVSEIIAPLQDFEVPYEKIVVVGQFGDEAQQCEYNYKEIYPEESTIATVTLDIH